MGGNTELVLLRADDVLEGVLSGFARLGLCKSELAIVLVPLFNRVVVDLGALQVNVLPRELHLSNVVSRSSGRCGWCHWSQLQLVGEINTITLLGLVVLGADLEFVGLSDFHIKGHRVDLEMSLCDLMRNHVVVVRCFLKKDTVCEAVGAASHLWCFPAESE